MNSFERVVPYVVGSISDVASSRCRFEVEVLGSVYRARKAREIAVETDANVIVSTGPNIQQAGRDAGRKTHPGQQDSDVFDVALALDERLHRISEVVVVSGLQFGRIVERPHQICVER